MKNKRLKPVLSRYKEHKESVCNICLDPSLNTAEAFYHKTDTADGNVWG
ncbi:MAG: hypothetical protein KAH00_00950 [Cocleimonas sp.]|nr:hypothetical protein [Cocleimonas sp.]